MIKHTDPSFTHCHCEYFDNKICLTLQGSSTFISILNGIQLHSMGNIAGSFCTMCTSRRRKEEPVIIKRKKLIDNINSYYDNVPCYNYAGPYYEVVLARQPGRYNICSSRNIGTYRVAFRRDSRRTGCC
ncbi:hypothetical protein ACOME3_004817 [Neoechinorhynchus agilis]